MHAEFMKNIPVADSSELLAVRLILASWAQKRLIPTFYKWCTSSSWNIFVTPIGARTWLLDSFRNPESKYVCLPLSRLDDVELMKNFLLADSSKLMAVRLISASWAQKHLIPTF